jgi:hypothetical protein
MFFYELEQAESRVVGFRKSTNRKKAELRASERATDYEYPEIDMITPALNWDDWDNATTV